MIERLAVLAALGSLVVRWMTGQWPWALWQGRDGLAREKRARACCWGWRAMPRARTSSMRIAG